MESEQAELSTGNGMYVISTVDNISIGLVLFCHLVGNSRYVCC